MVSDGVTAYIVNPYCKILTLKVIGETFGAVYSSLLLVIGGWESLFGFADACLCLNVLANFLA